MKLTDREKLMMAVAIEHAMRMPTKKEYKYTTKVSMVQPSTELPKNRRADEAHRAYIIHNGGMVTVRHDINETDCSKIKVVVSPAVYKDAVERARHKAFVRLEKKLRRSQFAIINVVPLLEHGYNAKELMASDDRVRRMRAQRMVGV